MCGPFIHGRSWWDKNISSWAHFCDPYKINAHNEMPVPGIDEIIELPQPMAMNVYEQAGLFREGKRRQIMVVDTFTRDANHANIDSWPNMEDRIEITRRNIDLSEVTGIEMIADIYRHGTIHNIQLRKKPRYVINWGLCPWNGEFQLQRGDVIPPNDLEFVPNLKDKNYLPQTRNDLICWAKNHWGKRDDREEFDAFMPGCLAYIRLWPQLPATSRTVADALINSARFVNDPELPFIESAETAYRRHYYGVRDALRATPSPCDRWAEMFKEAPNEFWAAKN